MDNFGQIFSLSTGFELEDELIDCCRKYFKNKDGVVMKESFRRSTADEDKMLGTDAFIYGLPVDFTCNFQNKNHMEVQDAHVSLDEYGSVRFGIRTGNGKVSFSQPVLVIGVDSTLNIKHYMQNIVDNFRKKLEELIELGSDIYWDFCDANGF